ncbi:MAG TPA: DNA-3-methyladenine glycosylase I [Sulfurospirillum sp. UBA12182]|nr:MAG TPA: DNA-3-methyladenine glycosylase I [Sulfurospirillum sp. UBA12182]
MQKKRCGWVKLSDEEYVRYHDEEWGVPLKDERALFELFSLETQAAGLSWLTVLKKRENYRKAFANFDLKAVSSFTCKEVDAIMQMDVIKNRAKIEAIINNAKLFLHVQKEYGSITKFFWDFVGGKPIINEVLDYKTAPCKSEISDALTKELKKRGFKFVGSVTIYAFMQACGMINDHEESCFCKKLDYLV